MCCNMGAETSIRCVPHYFSFHLSAFFSREHGSQTEIGSEKGLSQDFNLNSDADKEEDRRRVVILEGRHRGGQREGSRRGRG
jgi:hypothetical protein